jgi:hypothetical protein
MSAMTAILIGLPAGGSIASGLFVVPSSVPDPSAPILSSLPICGRHLPPLAVPRTHSPIYGYDNRYLMARANQPSDYDKINGGFVKSTADH